LFDLGSKEFEDPKPRRPPKTDLFVPISLEAISKEQAGRVMLTVEGQFADVKGTEVSPAKLTKTVSAFANADGGDLYIGIDEIPPDKTRRWRGFADQEAANGHLQIFEKLFPLGTDFRYEFLECVGLPGLVLHVQVNKTQAIKRASNGMAYLRRGAASQPVNEPELMRRLEYAKGITSFESELTNVSKSFVTESRIIAGFVQHVVPESTPEKFLRSQALLHGDRPTVAGVLLFADEPQALLPKHCGIKVAHYKTSEGDSREAMAFTPRTVEGCLYQQIKEAVKLTTEVIEGIPRMGAESFETVSYPKETLHEIITNAVLHRDYSIKDDVHIRVFDNRVEVQSPGRLPAHITVHNILDERCARNGAVVRNLNRFKDPPNKDVGEGLNTAFAAMHDLGLKEPVIEEKENSVLVTIKHEQLASPEEAIMDFLEEHPLIRNRQAREITHIRRDHQIKTIFGRMVKNGMIRQVPGTRTGGTAYEKVKNPSTASI